MTGDVRNCPKELRCFAANSLEPMTLPGPYGFIYGFSYMCRVYVVMRRPMTHHCTDHLHCYVELYKVHTASLDAPMYLIALTRILLIPGLS